MLSWRLVCRGHDPSWRVLALVRCADDQARDVCVSRQGLGCKSYQESYKRCNHVSNPTHTTMFDRPCTPTLHTRCTSLVVLKNTEFG